MAAGGFSATPPPFCTIYALRSSAAETSRCLGPRQSSAVVGHHQRFCSSHLKLAPVRFAGVLPKVNRLRCSSSTGPGGPGPGESDSRSVLDAFFLGKALGEALSERVESTVGEILGALGRLQAEQQKQVQDFQEEVLERAKRAKQKAAREAMGTTDVPATVNVNAATTVTSANEPAALATPSSSKSTAPESDDLTIDPSPNDQEPLQGVSNEG
ncbi:uncharacterized protein At4g13200, chloroplastic [Diospyros lotus]|uniref:uncharacterized protein At4g13200, chloroplastic n=1 Tax=Diospyros lotus TaxID=55363 RepID=UPI00224D061F|nr:uncharacterized protein At4g13200, chloroplastic [Diospyros lotus]